MSQSDRKTALITGASAGLGAEFARLFAQDGHDVVLVARRHDRLNSLAAELRKEGVEAHVIAADLTDPGAPQAIFERVRELGQDIEYLVNNAGFGSNGPFLDLPVERELEMVQVNITALIHLTQLFVPAMVTRRRGHVLNIGSTAGFQPGPFMATYYASKAFVNHFSEALSVELKDSGVRVTVHCPGATATEFGQVSGNDKSKLFARGVATSEDVARHAYLAMHAGQRMSVHGTLNKILVQSLRVSPRALVASITSRLNRP